MKPKKQKLECEKYLKRQFDILNDNYPDKDNWYSKKTGEIVIKGKKENVEFH